MVYIEAGQHNIVSACFCVELEINSSGVFFRYISGRVMLRKC